ncbi:PilW family protein [Haliovirga abyssi]|uniref:Prepilin-type N-terminal cleavage/methylation domain-containing protein n=1 Tax=Haliovirga abyssi TaxID=2996794 RepID=A0AAU9D4V2_9FUSO|nr:prepilin-type N-terminal cleavage/methylation domain-containing protein [Haliovirga abyssi]BDU49578.1 hypothetical protein HLVA_01470 [Haliovirga abyssi]
MKCEKSNGVTLIELLVAMAILVILVGMITPLFRSIGRVNTKQKELNRIDTSIGKSIDIIKREIRGAKNIVVNTSGTAVTITKADNTIVNFKLEDYSPARSEKNRSGGTSLVKWLQVNNDDAHLADNISNLNFQFTDNIFTLYMKIVYRGNEKEIRDAVTSRIN